MCQGGNDKLPVEADTLTLQFGHGTNVLLAFHISPPALLKHHKRTEERGFFSDASAALPMLQSPAFVPLTALRRNRSPQRKLRDHEPDPAF
jgi:hypothetical protein